MSRTYKDKPYRLRFKDKWKFVPEYGICQFGRGPKIKKRTVDISLWYKNTPSAWTRLMMTRPKRRECKVLERICVGMPISSLDEVMFPLTHNKPHIYYY